MIISCSPANNKDFLSVKNRFFPKDFYAGGGAWNKQSLH